MALLEIQGLKKTYPTGEVALHGVDLWVHAQEVVAVLGLSGSGKSTLLRCINRLVEPDAGNVVLDGVELTALDRNRLREMRRHMGMIFQEFNLVERLSVLENVLSGCLGSTSTWRALARALQARGYRSRSRSLRPGQHHRSHPQARRSAQRWTTPARRYRKSADSGSEDIAGRRADVESGSKDRRRSDGPAGIDGGRGTCADVDQRA